MVVSHDRNFLDAVTDETIIFSGKKLTYHAGNYQDWESTTEEQRRRKERLKEVGGDRARTSVVLITFKCSSTKRGESKSLQVYRKMSNRRSPPGTINVWEWLRRERR